MPLFGAQEPGQSMPKEDAAMEAKPPYGVADTAPVVEELLKRARMWQGRYRDDLVMETLDKLLRIEQDNVEALSLLAQAQLRTGKTESARQTLEHLRAIQPGHAVVAQIESQLRLLDSKDKKILQRARRLAQSGRQLVDLSYSRPEQEKRRMRAEGQHMIQSAVALFHNLYGDTPLVGDSALEYWQLVSDTPWGWSEAYLGLSRLVQDNPDNLRYELALAEHISTRPPVRPEVFRTFAKAAEMPELSKQTLASWRRALLRMELEQEERPEVLNARLPLVRNYLKRDPADSTIKILLYKLEGRRKQLSNPDYQAGRKGLAMLAGGDNFQLDSTEDKLRQGMAHNLRDGELIGGMGMLRLRQGRHAEAKGYFLQAERLDRDNGRKWKDLAATAVYWGLLREAKDATGSEEFLLAQHILEKAHRLSPREPAALVRLAQLQEGQQHDAQAEQNYRAALALAPGDDEALAGLAALYLRSGREQEALALQSGMSPFRRARMIQSMRAAQAEKFSRQAEQALARGEREAAARLYQQAIQADGDNPWLRYDLARLYAEEGQAGKGQALFDEQLERQPGNAEALYALALFQSGQDKDMDALKILERITPTARSSNMTQLQHRLWLNVQKQRVRWLASHGRNDEVQALLDRMEQMAGDDGDLALDVADASMVAGQKDRALRLANRFASARSSSDWLLHRAEQLARVQTEQDDAELAGLLEQASAARLTASQQKRLARLHGTLALHHAGALRKQGHYSEAMQVYRDILAQAPENQDAILGIIDIQIESGDIGGAKEQIARQWQASDEADFLAELLDRLVETGDDAQALKLAEHILALAPDHAMALRRAAQLAQRDGRMESAIAYQQRMIDRKKSLTAEQETSYGGDYRTLANMLDENSRWLSGAFDWHTRSGTSGTSQLDMKETTAELKQAASRYGNFYARADLVNIDAGKLDLASYAASTFGTQCPGCSGSVAQNATGLGFNAGIVSDDWRADIGTSPLGFPVQTVNGGLLLNGGWKTLSLSADISRRPVTSSLLSYAGARDPRTGAVWGGVQATGVRFGASRDSGGSFGAWASLGQHVLAGENVQSNNRTQLMGGAYWRLINEENRLLSIGLTAMHWRFGANAGEYTFGHGGYFSPESFSSLALPLIYGERSERLSYRVRTSLSTSRSRTAAAPFFPTSAALQAGSGSYYSASSGSGLSVSLGVEVEYQLERRMFIGMKAEIDRSVNYAPNRLLAYFRFNLDNTAARPVAFPPEPVFPTSQF